MKRGRLILAAAVVAAPAYAQPENSGQDLFRTPGCPEHKAVRAGEKAQGTVKFFNAMRGFGFITRDDGQPDAFVHISEVERAGLVSLNKGDRVEFEIAVDQRGKTSAVNLSPIE